MSTRTAFEWAQGGGMARCGEELLLVPLNSLKGLAVKPVTGQREGKTDGEREGEEET